MKKLATAWCGIFALQMSADATKNTLTYVNQSLDGSPPTTITRTPRITPCP